MAAVCCIAFAASQSALAPLGRPCIALVARGSQPQIRMGLQVVDLFPDPPVIGGNVVVAPPSRFPASLEVSPADELRKATLTPFPTFLEVVSSPMQPMDYAAGLLLGVALLIGPDFLLAPAGLVADKGIRPGYSLQGSVGAVIDPNGQWLRDRREGLKAAAPLSVQAPVAALFLAAGLVLERLLVYSFEDASFVVAIGVCSVFGGGLLEVIREPGLTREERDELEELKSEFLIFAVENLQRGGRCHENDIVASFRGFYPRYRRRDMSTTTDGVSRSDIEIASLARMWNKQMGYPAERTPNGFWKGLSVASPRGGVSDIF